MAVLTACSSLTPSLIAIRLSVKLKYPFAPFVICSKAIGTGGRFFKGSEKVLVLFHIGKQRFHGEVGKLLSLGLRNVKDGYNLKGGNGNFLFLLNRLSLAVKYGLSCVGVDFIHQLFTL